MYRICVMDGQGGGIGAAVIKRLKEVYGESVELVALGTNAIATAQMLKSRANKGASGENAIVRTTAQADVIIGPISIVLAHSMMGEVTPAMAAAVSASPAKKFLLPLSQENVEIVGVAHTPLPRLVETLVTENLAKIIPHIKAEL